MRAAVVLVKEVGLQPQTLFGKTAPLLTIANRFNHSREEIEEPPAGIVADWTFARAETMANWLCPRIYHLEDHAAPFFA